MGTAKQANIPVTETSPDQPGEHDPLLRRLHTPRDLKEKGWEGVARTYFSVAQTYASKNDRHIRELVDERQQQNQWKIEHLERSGREYARLLEKIKTRDGEIDQLKATIHLLTKARG